MTNVILFLIDATERPDSISILDGLSKEDYQYPDSPVEIVMAGKICISSNLASLQALYNNIENLFWQGEVIFHIYLAQLPDPVERNKSSLNVIGDKVGNGNHFEFASSSYATKLDIARPVEEVQEWLPESNPPPFPDCSVVSHSNLVVTMPTSLMFEFSGPDINGDDTDYYDPETSNVPESACDDKYFLGQVNI